MSAITKADSLSALGTTHTFVASGPEVSVVIPCLNEADTIGSCVAKAWSALNGAGIHGEVVVADNGSDDGSVEIALASGARIVDVASRGYGSALMAGFDAALGKYVIMGDADDSYDFLEIPAFVERLRQGFDLVQGCRLPSGGGSIMPGAMPFLHRWWGNPMFSWLARRWFGVPLSDVYCGMRGLTRSLYQRLDLRSHGMEFATEMVIKASLRGATITEVPITLHKDGRKAHPPHLKTFHDGWRTLRLFLVYSPRWLFLIPGLFLVLLGVAGYGLALPGVRIGAVTFDAHTLLFASLAVLCGYQSIVFGVLSRAFAVSQGLLPEEPRTERFLKAVNLEKGIVAGAVILVAGTVLLVGAVNQWLKVDFGRLDYSHTMRWVIPGATFTALGVQTVLSSFFLAILGMAKR
ncbi:MAG: glycosyltransferase family 2 protein [Blastocatellia bacterium]